MNRLSAYVLAASLAVSISQSSLLGDESAPASTTDSLNAIVRAETAKQLAEVSRASEEVEAVSRAASCASALRELQSMIELYKIQHADRPPSSLALLTLATDATGAPVASSKRSLGPYLSALPLNAFNDSKAIAAAGAATATTGWTYDPVAGSVRLVVPQDRTALAKTFSRDGIEVLPPAPPPPAPPALAETVTIDRDGLTRMVHDEMQRQFADLIQKQRVLDLQMRLSSARATVQTFRGQVELYRLQHDDKLPTTIAALLKKTNEDGEILDNGKFGPYLAGVPQNPFTGLKDVAIGSRSNVVAGWLFDPKSGEIFAILPLVLAPITEDVKAFARVAPPLVPQTSADAAPNP